MGIFVKGKLIACGPIGELGRQLQNEGQYTMVIEAEPADAAMMSMLEKMEHVRSVTADADGLIKIDSQQDVRQQVLKLLLEKGYSVSQLRQEGGDLDEIYRRFFEKAGEQDDGKQQNGEPKENLWQKILRMLQD